MPLSCAGGCSLATQDTLQLRSSAPTEAFLSCYLPPCARVTMAREWSAANVWCSTPNVNELLRLAFELEKPEERRDVRIKVCTRFDDTSPIHTTTTYAK